MTGLKAVVLEKKGSMLTVLTSDGSFKKVRRRDAVEVGQEIEIPAVRALPNLRIGVSIAAIFLIAFMSVFGWNAFQPGTAVAMVSLDINPSLQISLDRKGRVLELEALNPDAEQVLSELSLKGEGLNEALDQIIEQSAKLHYLNSDHNWVIVGYSPNLSKTRVDPSAIVKHIEETAQENGVSPQIAVYELSAEEDNQAQQHGLTIGEYGLMNSAQRVGVKVAPQAMKKTDERVRILKKPEVVEQMEKEKAIKVRAQKAQTNSGGPQKGKDQEPGINPEVQSNQPTKKENSPINGQSTANEGMSDSRGESNDSNVNSSQDKNNQGSQKEKEQVKNKENKANNN